MKLFDLYRQVRAIRQAVGDKKEELIRAGRKEEVAVLRRVADMLDGAECELEELDLKIEEEDL